MTILKLACELNAERLDWHPGQQPGMCANTTSEIPMTMTPGSDDNTADSKRRRVDVACDYCRRRKMRCDGGRPKCTYCATRTLLSGFALYLRRSCKATLEHRALWFAALHG